MSELEPVWSGATWRTFPAPVVAPHAARPAFEATHQIGRVLAALHDDWQSRDAVRERAEIDGRRVRECLAKLVEDGLAERQSVRTKGRAGQAPHFYRRRRQDVAA